MIDVKLLIEDLIDPLPCSFDHHSHCQAHGWFEYERPCPQARIRELLAERHAVDFGPAHFAVLHTLDCRPNMLDCPIHLAISTLDGPPVEPGRYWTWFEEGELTYERQDG